MSRLKLTRPEDATGPLAEEYAAARQRAGRIWNIVALMSPNPAVLRASMGLYRAIMHGASPLSRVQRELLAVVVSQTNGCKY
ncbi:MAG TPA: carboxymuconolactone decarboxylase family protein [Gemmatimonadales bacterium]|nr:carboxymuconolactone decarboxylase family protein [Gemmatimonadales bacterium]